MFVFIVIELSEELLRCPITLVAAFLLFRELLNRPCVNKYNRFGKWRAQLLHFIVFSSNSALLHIAIIQRVQNRAGFVHPFNVALMEATLEELLYPLPPTALAILNVATTTPTPVSRAQKAWHMLKY